MTTNTSKLYFAKSSLNNLSAFVAVNVMLTASQLGYADEQASPKEEAEEQVEELVVTATDQSLNDLAQPVRIFSEEDMQSSQGSTVGELLARLPGVSNASFGAGVGRPVIRGLTGNRVKLTVNGTDTNDVSAMSSDHSPMLEAANAQQLEIIYGPSTLRFGSSAMGGVVNMADSRLHEIPLAQSQGQVSTSASSADNGTNLNLRIDTGNGPWIVHFDGFSRQSENYRAGDNHDVNNTSTKSEGINLGLSYVDISGNSFGVAASTLDYEYGVPNPDNQAALVGPTQMRLDAQAVIQTVPSWLEQVKTKLTYVDYEHGEGFDNTVVGFFDKTSTEFNSTVRIAEVAGWLPLVGLQYATSNFDVCHDHGGCDGIPSHSNLTWDGQIGSNLERELRDGFLFAHDTPMPLSATDDLGLYLITESEWQHGLLELGARIDQRSIAADPESIRPSYRQDQGYYDDKTFNSLSLSAAMTWQLDDQKFGLSVSRSQRAPTADEIYWNGDHHATFSFQLDNPDLEIETAQSLDLTWNYAADGFHIQSGVFYYDFDGYIYNDLKTVTDPFHGNPVYRYEQRDAWISGMELQLDYEISEQWGWFVGSDVVKAQLKEGANKNLPRTPPFTLLTGIQWQKNQWIASTDVKYYAEQTDVANNEASTDGYHVLNAYIAYIMKLSDNDLRVYFRGHNLTDEFGRNHVSYLKAYSPVMGRNLNFGLSYSF